ncbi:MFS transporter [Reinekea sp.]|jgi:MFS family permease|uniref:MFS transporter n=1 Tax=Reinekea sp. TaxID=1970455 RepID=UPI002A81031D|nr:MFS transporter [Reinekea sp.]
MNLSKTEYRRVLLAACLMLMLSIGYRSGFGLFIHPLSDARGWGRDVLSLALATQNLAWGVIAVFAGALADRFGNMKVILAGVVCYAAGMWGMSVAQTEGQIIFSAGILVGAGIAGTSFGIVLPAIVRAVPDEKRGWALGVGTAAGSFGQFLIVPLMQVLIDGFGLYPSLKILAASAFVMALLAIPLAPFSGRQGLSSSAVEISMWTTLVRALKVRSYVLLMFGFFVCGFHVAFITVHMPGYVVDLGFDAKVGAWSISLIGLCNVFGAYIAGVQSGKRPKHLILAGIYLGRVVAISAFVLMPVSLFSILLFSAIMGFLWLATVPPTSGLVAVFFGTRYMAFLYGIVFLSHQLGSFSGVWLGGYLYEHYGNYDGIWYLGIVLGLVAAALHWPIQERPANLESAPAN